MRNLKIILSMLLIGTPLFFTAACSKKHDDSPASKTTTKAALYHCPMHPRYTSDLPGDCPICHMRLVLINDETPSKPAGAPGEVRGQSSVHLSEQSAERIGVAVTPVARRELIMSITASGRVAYDPALYSAILEYQEALRGQAAGSLVAQKEGTATLVASRLRLRQMGLSDAQIAAIEAPGHDASNLLLGEAGGKVWVYVEVYDSEAALVRPGQRVELTASAFPGQTFVGTVRAVDAIVNSETRTLRARVEVPNPNGELKPEMYVSATIRAGLGRALAVPVSAVMDTGVRQLVYVESSAGQYEPREIRVGREAAGLVEIVGGLKEGELVVTSANFLIDSESKIRAASHEDW